MPILYEHKQIAIYTYSQNKLKIIKKFDVPGSVHRERIFKYNQQDAGCADIQAGASVP